jgi:O-antigen/teichoic acid export membrane protein
MVLCSAAALKVHVSSESYLIGQVAGIVIPLGIFGLMLYPKTAQDQPLAVKVDAPSGKFLEYEAQTDSVRELLNRVLHYGLPFVPLAIVSWVSNVGDRYFIGGYLGKADVGLYAAAYGLASRPFIMLGNIGAGFARPILFQAESDHNRAKARRIFFLWLTLIGATSALGVVAFGVLGTWIARLLLAAEYRESAPAIFVWVGIGYAVVNIMQILETRLMSKGATRKLIVPSTASAAANIGLNILLIPRFGPVGAAQATAATFLLQSLMLGWNFVKPYGMISRRDRETKSSSAQLR